MKLVRSELKIIFSSLDITFSGIYLYFCEAGLEAKQDARRKVRPPYPRRGEKDEDPTGLHPIERACRQPPTPTSVQGEQQLEEL
jgi:hypothetical protein